MLDEVLSTKLYIPHPRVRVLHRSRLYARLDEGLSHAPSVTLVSAPAGYGKTTLVGEWAARTGLPTAWISLDEEDNDPARFFTYLVAAIRKMDKTIGEEAAEMLSTTPRPFAIVQSILNKLLNEIAGMPGEGILVLDDYHVINSPIIQNALTFILQHLPANLHIVIASREDPDIPLARMRVQNRLVELRVPDLRFTPSETADFFTQSMRVSLSSEEIAGVESLMEGWIAGLQMATISIHGKKDFTRHIQSFSGNHRFVMDYLIEEVLKRQPQNIQTFLLRTSILDSFCASLCDAVLQDPSLRSQNALEYVEHANLFVIPLDDEGRWYRYHHLFSEFLRQQLRGTLRSLNDDPENTITKLHIRASQWYEDQGMDLEAFKHAGAGNDIARAERLIEGKGIPLHFRGAAIVVRNWLASLPSAVLDEKPSLLWRYASILLINGQTSGVEAKLRSAETALQNATPNEANRNLLGQIALTRATLALTRYDTQTMLAQSLRSLEYLSPANRFSRATANWSLGYAHLLRGERAASRHAFTEAIDLSQESGDVFTTILSIIGSGNALELDNQLYQAADTYQHSLKLAGDHPIQVLYEAYLGLARIHYEWNDLELAEQYGLKSLQMARQYERGIDRFIVCEVFLARLRLAKGDTAGAAAILAGANQSARRQNFSHRMPDIAAVQALVYLRQSNLAAVAHLIETYDLPLIRVRLALAQGNPLAGSGLADTIRKTVEEKAWKDELFRVKMIQAVLCWTMGEIDPSIRLITEALSMAEPGRYIRSFIDEGPVMSRLLAEAYTRGLRSEYIDKLLAAFDEEARKAGERIQPDSNELPVESLSKREMDVLRLIALGLTNQEISERLFLALDTVKNHNRRIFNKLQVQRRTEAIARARELGLL